MKLAKALSTFMAVLTNKLQLTHAASELVKFGLLIIFLVHYLACAWAFVGLNVYPSNEDTAEGSKLETTWVAFTHMQGYPPYKLYAASCYVAIVAIFGGVTEISPQNFTEYIVISAMMLVGGLVWSYVLGSLCGIFASLNPQV